MATVVETSIVPTPTPVIKYRGPMSTPMLALIVFVVVVVIALAIVLPIVLLSGGGGGKTQTGTGTDTETATETDTNISTQGTITVTDFVAQASPAATFELNSATATDDGAAVLWQTPSGGFPNAQVKFLNGNPRQLRLQPGTYSVFAHGLVICNDALTVQVFANSTVDDSELMYIGTVEDLVPNCQGQDAESAVLFTVHDNPVDVYIATDFGVEVAHLTVNIY